MGRGKPEGEVKERETHSHLESSEENGNGFEEALFLADSRGRTSRRTPSDISHDALRALETRLYRAAGFTAKRTVDLPPGHTQTRIIIRHASPYWEKNGVIETMRA